MSKNGYTEHKSNILKTVFSKLKSTKLKKKKWMKSVLLQWTNSSVHNGRVSDEKYVSV